ncbi:MULTISPECIES: GvpL/GvpF family gas vesicle protein [unclassified Streptomyces]|uniref:GvpL/GvpF family gas vesicle protein n=1 Tax=Streptomyces sp. NPDC006678 TaxID=3157185 RepID=UPI0033FCA9CF
MAVYVYSIAAKEHPLRIDEVAGVGDPPSKLRTVTASSLTAVVSDAPDDLRPKRRDLTAHQEVQNRLMADGTVLPLRFGLTAPDDEAVRSALEERAGEYADRLRALEDCAEYHLKVKQDEESLLRQILEESSTARELNDSIRNGSAGPDVSVALGELVAGEVEARHASLAAGVVEALRPFARDHEVSRPTGEDFLSVSFLVAQDHDEGFLTTELSLANQMGEDFEFRLNGPLPPYSFV